MEDIPSDPDRFALAIVQQWLADQGYTRGGCSPHACPSAGLPSSRAAPPLPAYLLHLCPLLTTIHGSS